jgi:hypothetical protein
MSTQSIASVCISGEYFVAAELTRMGHLALISMRNWDKVDILASNADGTRTVSIQVKTQRGNGRKWVLGEKNETICSDNLFYVFVTLKGVGQSPDYYIVPSKVVATAIRDNHKRWLKTPGRKGQKHNDTTMRSFVNYAEYKDCWGSLGLQGD